MIRPTLLSLLITTLLVPASHAVGTGTPLDDLAPATPTAADKKATAEAKAQAERERLAREASDAKVKELERKLAAEEARRKAAEATSEANLRKADAAAAAKKQAEQKAADQLAVEQAKRQAEVDAIKRKAEAEAAATAERERQAREASVQKLPPGQVIQDCPDCPKMVVIPAGRFTMGSPDGETGRDPDEGPQHPVRVESFLMGQTEVTVAQFRRFTQVKGYQTDAERNAGGKAGCYEEWYATDGKRDLRGGPSWRMPSRYIKDNEPVACISWNDAKAYVDWLRQLTGKAYQLPTEAQWEYAARGVTTREQPSPSRYWGDDPNQACLYANVPDQTNSPDEKKTWSTQHACKDDYDFLAPVATFKPNAFGLYDMLGNQWEWAQDCYNKDEYQRRKDTRGEWLASKASEEKAGCTRVLRVGSFNKAPVLVRSANRNDYAPDDRSFRYGFRVSRTAP